MSTQYSSGWYEQRAVYEAASEQQSAAVQQQYQHALMQWHQAYDLWLTAVQSHMPSAAPVTTSSECSQASSTGPSCTLPAAQVTEVDGAAAATATSTTTGGEDACGRESMAVCQAQPTAAAAARHVAVAAASSQAAAAAWSASSWEVASALCTGAMVACPTWQRLKHLQSLHPVHAPAASGMLPQGSAPKAPAGQSYRTAAEHSMPIGLGSAGTNNVAAHAKVTTQHQCCICTPKPRQQIRRWQLRPYRTSMFDQSDVLNAVVCLTPDWSTTCP